jgi:FAD/FMN-containing dehydrogenase
VTTPVLITDPRVRAAYAEGAGIYRIVPQAVAIPDSVEALQHVVRWAAETGTPLVPRGAGSAMPGNNVGAGVIVDCTRGFGGVTVDAGRRTARAGAGATWREVTEAARPYGLRLPPDPSSGAFATSGGMAATNAAGPRSVRCGSVREWIGAMEIVTADGEARRVERGMGNGERFVLSSDDRRLMESRFPKTRKNSSGYALDAFAASGDELDLLIGSEGTLAFTTAVEWRLEPTPTDAAGLAIALRDLDALGDAVPFLVSLNPAAVELLDATLLAFLGPEAGVPEGLACLLLVEFERETAAAARGVVGDAVRGLREITAHVETAVDRAGLEQLWAVRRLASPALARLPASRRSLQVIEDGCVPLEKLAAYVTGLRAAAAERGIPVALFGHAGDGHIHANALPDLNQAGWRDALAGLYADIAALLTSLGGTPSGEHGDGRLRAGLLERVFGSAVVTQFRALKAAYDPRGILNPGVILPAAGWAPLAGLKVGADAAPLPDDIAARLREMERNASWGTPKPDLARP